MTDKELLRNALEEKLLTAEKRIGILRLLISVFNAFIYLTFWSETGYSTFALSVIVFALVYSSVTLVFELYRKIKILRSVYLTTIGDGLLIAAWICATGYVDSPFYVLWYVSVIAVALRYSLLETAVSAFAYLMLYLGVFFLDPYHNIDLSDLLVRIGYIPLAGMLGMYISIEISDQIDDKMKILKGEKALQEANDQLEVKVIQRTKELSVINKDITDSINYAERIQTATMPTSEEFQSCFPDSFIIHKPKDIISGDFHWLHEKKDVAYLAVVDCTGHGVPGAMMSMIGNNLLNRAFIDKGIEDPAEALTDMDLTLGNMLKNDSEDNAVNDGMDLTLCVIDRKNRAVRYEGACGHGYVISKEGDVTEMESTRFSIGGLLAGEDKNFQTRTINYEKGDLIYLFSDGYQDQFGGPRGKKFYRKNLISLIQSIQELPMNEQSITLQKSLRDWMGPLSQVDDVTVIGLRL